MIPDLKNKRFVVLGIQGAGKSVLIGHILKSEKNHLVYDVHHEHKKFNTYQVEHRQVRRPGNPSDPAIVELNNLVDRVVLGSGRIRLFVIEETNRYCPNKYPLPSSILTLNDDQRHDRIAFGTLARRAAQLNTDLVELAHYMFIFRQPGKNDRQYLDEIAEGLGDLVQKLPKYHFVIVDEIRDFQVHKPVDL